MVKIKKSRGCPKRPLKRKCQIELYIELHKAQKDLPVSAWKMKKAARQLLSYLQVETDLLIIHAVTQKCIARLHKRFFDDPTPTDCISLPIDAPEDAATGCHVLGEIFLCPAMAKIYAKKYGTSTEEEFLRYLIHGVLHLIGYNDMQRKDRLVMKKKEEDCLSYLKRNQ